MIALSALVVVPALMQTPAQPNVAPDGASGSGAAIERLDSLRCRLLERDLTTPPRTTSCFSPPVVLGQWRN
jgi:hypothetical protein